MMVFFLGTKEEIEAHKKKDNFNCFFHHVNCQNRYCDQCKHCEEFNTHYIYLDGGVEDESNR